jgi:ABC-type nitrate/sulfonate/bicarbonate transport system substrate-binding protein
VPIRAASVFVDLVDSPLYIGFTRGYFTQAGIELQMQQFSTLQEMLEPLTAGRLEVAFDAAPGVDLFNALAGTRGLTLVANQGTTDGSRDAPFYALAVAQSLADSGQVTSVSDLRGRPVNIVARGSAAQFNVDQALRTGGLSLDDVQVREMPMQASMAELRGGSLAASFLAEPFVTQGRLDGNAHVLVNLEKLAPARDVADVLYTTAFAQRQPVANNFMVAYLRGVRDYLKLFSGRPTPERTNVVDQLIGFLSVKDARLFDQMTMPAMHPDGRMNAADLQFQRDWFVSQGLVSSQADVTQSIDTQFLDFAVSQLGPYQAPP